MTLPIDRTLFASLTFAMAAGACATTRPGEVAAIEIPPQPPQPADAGAARTDVAKPSSAAKELLTAAPSEDDDDDDIGTSTMEGGVAVAQGPGCGWVDAATIVKPAKCGGDEIGTVGACTMMKACQGFAFPRQKCEAYRKYLKPKVAQKALDCLGKLTQQQACDACNAYKCGDLAMKSACPDATADATCAQVTAKCKSLSMTECKTYFSGLNAQGRTKLAACMTASSGCGFGIYSCAEGLF